MSFKGVGKTYLATSISRHVPSLNRLKNILPTNKTTELLGAALTGNPMVDEIHQWHLPKWGFFKAYVEVQDT